MYAGPDVDRSREVPEGIVDSSRVELILTYNSFITQDEKDFAGSQSDMQDNSGFWLYPCYFNHSCVPNMSRLYLKDFVMFYATKDVEPGEELTTQYTGMSKYDEREKVSLFKHSGISTRLNVLNNYFFSFKGLWSIWL